MAARTAAQDSNLDKYQCMFTWCKAIRYPIDSLKVVTTQEDKLLTADCEWQAIVYHLVLFYEYYRLEKKDKARDHLVECENIISHSECVVTSPLVKRNSDAIKHVLYSSWIHTVAETESPDTFKEYLTQILLYRNMSKQQKSGILAIHAACLMEYGSEGRKEALMSIQQALQHNEHEGHWHFLQGEILRNARLQSSDLPPTIEEIKCFECALFYDELTPSHYIGLAASLYDSVKKENGLCEIRNRATQHYKAALENWPNSAYVNVMCASGLLSYAYPYRDTRLADKCLAKALGLAPKSSFVNLVAGIFFKWPNNNQIAANRHFNLAKTRYHDLVDQITKKEINSYRRALILGLVGPSCFPSTNHAPVLVAEVPPASHFDQDLSAHLSIEDDDDDDEYIDYMYDGYEYEPDF